MPTFEVENIANYHCECGENPLWDNHRNLLFWVDIPTGRLFQYDPNTNEHKKIYDDEVVGGFTIQESGLLLLFRVSDLVTLDPETGTVSPFRKYTDDSMERFNDVFADPEGRVYAGTIGKDKDSGGLYRVDLDGTITKLFSGTGCSNGMVLDPEHKHFFWTCTSTKKIFQFDYERSTGELSNRSTFIDLSAEEGLPDGLTLDVDGTFWSATWLGAQIRCFDSSGSPVAGPNLPVQKITSAAFGGSDLSELYITSAGGSSDSQNEEGSLFRIKTNTKGRPDFPSRIQIK